MRDFSKYLPDILNYIYIFIIFVCNIKQNGVDLFFLNKNLFFRWAKKLISRPQRRSVVVTLRRNDQKFGRRDPSRFANRCILLLYEQILTICRALETVLSGHLEHRVFAMFVRLKK